MTGPGLCYQLDYKEGQERPNPLFMEFTLVRKFDSKQGTQYLCKISTYHY